MQRKDNDNNLGKHGHHAHYVAAESHVEEDAEDIHGQEGDDNALDNAHDDGFHLVGGTAQHRVTAVCNAQTHDERQHKRTHHVYRGRNVDGEIG